LAILTASGGRSIRAEQLADELWEGRLVSEGALRVTVNRLRKRWVALTGVDPLQSSSAGYRLLLARGESDSGAYEELVADARRSRQVGDPGRAKEQFDRAEALWRGPPYDGFAHLPTVTPEHDRLEGVRWSALEERAAALLELGDLDGALAELADMVAREPFRESLWGLQMVVLARSGRQRDALAAFTRARRLLDDELGIAPGEDLRRMERAILDQRPTAELTMPILERHSAAGARDRRRFDSPPPDRAAKDAVDLVGRDRELAVLHAAADEATRSGLQLVVVSGEPGIGKTALLERAAADHRTAGHIALVGRCDRNRAVPLHSVLQALDPIIRAETSGAGAEVAHLLRAPPEQSIPRSEQVELQRHRVLSLLGDLIGEQAGHGPLLLGIDDAQWVDPMSLALVEHVSRSLSDRPILLVVTIRSTDLASNLVDDLLADLGREVPVTVLRLAALEPETIRQLLGGDVSDGSSRRIQRAAGGNPLYALQLHHLLGDPGTADEPLPPDLQRLCSARIAALSPDALVFLEVAAVAGFDMNATDVASLLRQDRAEVSCHLIELQRCGLIEAADGFDRFRFVHGLIRHAVYEQIEQGRRAALHLAVADALEATEDPRAGDVALHLAQARPLATDARIAEAAMHGAQESMQLGGPEDTTVRFYRIVLDLVSPSPEQRAIAQFGLGLGLAADGDLVGSTQRFSTAISEARAVGRWDVVADVMIARIRFGVASNMVGAMTEATVIDEILDHLAQDEHERRAHLLFWKAELLMNVSPEVAREALRSADSLAAMLHEPALDGLIRYARIRQADATLADPQECRRLSHDLLDTALAMPDLTLASRAGLMLQSSRFRCGDLVAAREQHQEFEQFAVAANDPGLVMQHRLAGAAIALATEPLDTADAHSQDVTGDPTAGLEGLATISRLMHLTIIRREQLRLREIEPLLLGALALSPRKITRPLAVSARLEDGDADGATEQLEIFAEELSGLSIDWAYLATLALAAEAVAHLGYEPLAEPLERRLDVHAPQVVVACSALLVLGHVDRHLGLMAALRGELDLAIDRLENARQLDTARGMPLWAAWSAHGEAVARRRRARPGDATRAGELLAIAAATATEFGSPRLTQQVERAASTLVES